MKLFASLVEIRVLLSVPLVLQRARRMELTPKTPQIPPQVQQMTAVFGTTVPYLSPVLYLELAGTLRAQSIALAAANLGFAALGLAYLLLYHEQVLFVYPQLSHQK